MAVFSCIGGMSFSRKRLLVYKIEYVEVFTKNKNVYWVDLSKESHILSEDISILEKNHELNPQITICEKGIWIDRKDLIDKVETKVPEPIQNARIFYRWELKW